MAIAWTEAARAAVHPHRRVPAAAWWPDAARAERLLARLRDLRAGVKKPRLAEAELRDRLRRVSFETPALVDPRDEAVRALVLGAADWAPGDEPAGVLVGFWTATGGPAHALASLVHTWRWDATDGRLARRAGQGFDPDALGLWHAFRRLGVTLDDDGASAVVHAAAPLREEVGAGLLLDAALAYALPWSAETVRPAARALLAALASWQAQPVMHAAAVHGWCVLASVDEPELAVQIATHAGAYGEARPDTFAATLLDRLGADAVPVLERLFDGVAKASARRRLAEVLALVETDEAARWLARHVAHPQVAGAATAWLSGHPALAIPALAAAAGGRRAEPAAAALLAQLVARHGVPAGLRLSPALRARVAVAAEPPPPPSPQADDAALPAVWTRLRLATRKLPPFVAGAALPPVRLRSGERVSPSSMAAVLRSVAESAPELVADDVGDVRAALDPSDAALFARAVLDAWLGAGAPPKEGWVVLAFGVLAPAVGAMPLARLIDGWAKEARVRRAVLGLDGLAAMGSDEALFALHRLAAKAAAPSVAERAAELLDETAEARAVDRDTLEDLALPSLGLDTAGRLRLDYGRRQFVAGFDDRGKAVVTDAAGRVLARLPPAGKDDDPRSAQDAQERWKDVRAAGEFVLARQSVRLEAAMCARRGWSAASFDRLVRPPLVAWLAKRVVWGAGGTTFRIAEDWTFADVDDRECARPDGLVVIPHPLEVPDATKARWSALLADYELVPPFPQMQRPVFRPTAQEVGASEILRVDGRPTTRAKLYGLRHRGWEGLPDEMGTVLARVLPGDAAAFLEVADGRLGRVRVRGGGGARVKLGALDPVVFSELVRDLEWAALGNVADDVGER